MKTSVLAIFAVGAGVAGAAVSGCGGNGELPDDAVAQVGDTVITKAHFEKALSDATGGSDPRDQAACVAAKQRSGGELGEARQDEADLARQCREDWARIKSNVMDSLIKAEWTRMEARERGIALTDAQVRKVVDRAARGGILDAEALRRSGVSQRELLARVRANQLEAKVTEQVTDQARDVSDQDIADHYRRSKAELVVPDRREIRIVITRTPAKARAARAALDAGRRWKNVARRFSLHFSRNQGGRITAEWKGEDKAGLGAAIFEARKGELTGPFQDDDTWAVFVVERIMPGYQPTLGQARNEIVEQLQTARTQQALAAFRRKYRSKTSCARGFEVPACGNGPEDAGGRPRA
jgi:foldase protein PrsA